jgi:hypothetical protein
MDGPASPEDPALAPARVLAEDLLADPDASWSMGTIGALAEFTRNADESVSRGPACVVTERGGIRLRLSDEVEAIAYETPAGPDLHWNQAVAFCLPVAVARRSGRTVVTEIGPDTDALRPQDTADILFDLGLDTPSVDACVRTADPALLEVLRDAEGEQLFTTPAAAALVEHRPHRVFLTAAGRVEVYTPIPPPEGRSPLGPHTHLLPHLLARARAEGRTHPPTVPIPDDLVPVAHVYPPHPSADHLGRPLPFDPERLMAFQRLLDAFGDPVLGVLKAGVVAAVRAGRGPRDEELPRDAAGRAAVSVALRQLARTDGSSVALHTWRSRHREPPELLDPEGDPHGG